MPTALLPQQELSLALIQAGARIREARLPQEPNPEAARAYTAEEIAEELPAKPNPEPPRMYVAEGCDGSTATIQHAIRILALHGIDAGRDEIGREWLNPSSNPMYHKSGPTHNNIIASMKHMQKHFREKNQTLLYKSILHRDLATTTSAALRNMGTLAVYVHRDNTLDQLVCMVRDCFLNTNSENTVVGYPVNSKGKPSDMCFKRRSSNAHEKALLRVSQGYPDAAGRLDKDHGHNRSFLGEALEKLQTSTDRGYKALLKAGYRTKRIAYEDMIAFEEGGEKNMETSLAAWESLLKAWAVKANKAELKKYLNHYKGYRQVRQRSSIYNYKEVAEELKKLGKEYLLRD